MRILIADDGRFARKVLTDAVAELGHESVAVADGIAAWEAIQSAPVDVVVTGWEMPGLTGIDLCRRIRTAGLDSYVYVIVLTAHAARDDRFEALAAGADDLLTKPLDAAELAARLAVAARILQWSAQLQAVNDLVVENSRQLMEKAAQIDALRREAEHLASHDPLTGLLNRRAWMASMEESAATTTVAMVDIDHFKRVNDTFGHPAGDVVLCEVAGRLADGPGSVARFGGEEFAIAFSCSPDDARAWCEQVREVVAANSVQTGRGPVQVSISIGLTRFEGDLDDAIRRADGALYNAKDGGRNRVAEWMATAA